MAINLEDWKFGRTTEKGAIRKTVLRKDIERGVRFLNEQAYSNISGCTRSSALFCMQLRKHIDFDLVYRVDMMYTHKHHYTVRLYTKDGYVIQLKGFSFGYYGEGSRGSLAILKECGFTSTQMNKLFAVKDDNGAKIRMFRRIAV